MAESSSKVPIVVALIGVTGTVGAALIANWDKLFGRRAEPPAAMKATPADETKTNQKGSGTELPVRADSAARTEPRAGTSSTDSAARRANSIVNLAGLWRDAHMPGNVGRIVQDGERFQFENAGVTPQGIAFRSTGTGTVSGARVRTSYVTIFQNGATARGDCSGTASADGAQMTLTCADPLSGTFVTSGIRQ